jgi:raffinose/stachyose/melibiose transport system permease protein
MKKNGFPRKQVDIVTGDKKRFAFKPRTILVHILLLALVFINIFPLYWMVTFSLKDNDEILGYSTKVKVMEEVVDEATGEVTQVEKEKRVQVLPNHVGLPQKWEWSNYTEAMKTGNMGQYFLNSLVVTISAIAITMIASFMATYAMTRLVWKGRKTMNKFFMLGLTIPIHAAIVPVYVMLSRLGLLNTYSALIFPYAAFALAMGILISSGFMGDIPYDLDEAAFLDGCGVWGIFFRVIAPLMMPAIATVGIYTFLQCWNELLFATVFVSSGKYRTLPVGVQQLFGQYTTRWGPIGAALTIATLPTLIAYIFLSKRIQDSFIAGAVKG